MITSLTVEKLGPVLTQAESESRRWAGRRVLVIVVLAVIALGGALAAGALPRLRQEKQMDAAATQAAAQPPMVTVVAAQRVAAAAERVLPGHTLPLLEAALYARATGFIQLRLVDIGDRVAEGQLLAEIATPEIDAQLDQARATLLQTRATVLRNEADEALAAANLARANRLSPVQGIAQQELDTNVSQAKAARATTAASKATLKVNEAEIERLQALQSFQKVTAPFAGVITARNVDPGALVTADSTTRELFHLMRTDVLRVFVNVPQVFSTGVKVGQKAVVYRRESPSKEFKGKVTRTADALDPNTRTLVTEVQIPNPDNALRPGMYLQVKFVFDRGVERVLIPAAALATRIKGPRVAVLDDQHRVHYRAVELGRDHGAQIEVIAGLKPGETVVVHPGDDLPEGTVVQPVPMAK